MAGEQTNPCRQIRAREVRWIIYLLILLGIAAWKYVPRPWRPTLTIETPHYAIYSTADREQTERIGRVAEFLYTAYSNRFGTLPGFKHDHPKLKLRLYKDRKEFRWVNPNLGWAEAYYRKPFCRAYYSAEEINPYHWMLHEAVHQLNCEVAQVHVAKWLDEGIAEYFSTSRISRGELELGRIDPNTYPVWWIDNLATKPELQTNLANGSVIPLRAIITNSGGPSLNKECNLYYLHWWTLTYFIFETGRHREAATTLVQAGGGLDAFARLIGPIDVVQTDWHAYVRRMKAGLSGQDLEFLRTLEGDTRANP